MKGEMQPASVRGSLISQQQQTFPVTSFPTEKLDPHRRALGSTNQLLKRSYHRPETQHHTPPPHPPLLARHPGSPQRLGTRLLLYHLQLPQQQKQWRRRRIHHLPPGNTRLAGMGERPQTPLVGLCEPPRGSRPVSCPGRE